MVLEVVKAVEGEGLTRAIEGGFVQYLNGLGVCEAGNETGKASS